MTPTDSGGNVPPENGAELLIRQISGFRPALTGTLCDLCNRALDEGDTVTVRAIWHGTDATAWDGTDLPPWSLSSTWCESCAADVDPSDDPTERLVRCELGPVVADGEAAPLYNPEVL
jgi:hypothetical protein